MSDQDVLHIATQAMVLALKLAGPCLIVALVLGFAISLLQAVTQVQEATLTFVPKLVACTLVLLLMGNWMMQEAVSFTHQIISDAPGLIRR